ncbi:MAG: phospholipase D-like domain-containing protein [Candidatus Thorarchaeota archaeon]
MSTSRLGRVAREALLLTRKFMGQGDSLRASQAALKAAEAFNEIAKHSTGKASKVAVRRAKVMIEITKVLRREEPLPMDLVEALDTFFPADALPSIQPTKKEPNGPEPKEIGFIEPNEANDELITPAVGEEKEASIRQLLTGISIACTLVEMLDRATESIRLMVENFTDVRTITIGSESCEVNLIDRLTEKAKDGVTVRIIIREPEGFGAAGYHFRDAIEKLLQASSSIDILVCGQIHIKALIVDGSEVMEGSANFTTKGLSGIGEQATWTNNLEFVNQFVERFDHYWVHQGAECVDCKNRTCEAHPLTRRQT